ncbi:MAG: four helix bundle protein [Bacteroidales bacterium]|nr:four helix bundle protein [Bacteroidales bacterium]
MHKFKELKIWQKSRSFVKKIYETTALFPESEKYGLCSQMQRAEVSVPSNIAEGSGRTTNKEFSHFLDIAMGSSFELETLFILANDLNYIDENLMSELSLKTNKIQKMIYSFKKQVNQSV